MDRENSNIYDLITVGAGPAGFSAALYAVRYRLSTLVIGQMPGGTAGEAHKICNFPTEIEITGPEIGQKMYSAATHHGAEVVMDTVSHITKADDVFILETVNGDKYRSKAVLAAVGTKRRNLGVPGEAELFGRGVSYCATCDGMFYRNRKVAVIGGSDAALTAALYLADVAKHVHLIYRGDSLRGDGVWIEKVQNNENITIHYNKVVSSIVGEKKVEGLNIESPEVGTPENLEIEGVFIEIGSKPGASLFTSLELELDDKGYIKVEADQRTNVEGLWAAGDITNGSNGFRQIITAAAEGAIAAEDISRYLRHSSKSVS